MIFFWLLQSIQQVSVVYRSFYANNIKNHFFYIFLYLVRLYEVNTLQCFVASNPREYHNGPITSVCNFSPALMNVELGAQQALCAYHLDSCEDSVVCIQRVSRLLNVNKC